MAMVSETNGALPSPLHTGFPGPRVMTTSSVHYPPQQKLGLTMSPGYVSNCQEVSEPQECMPDVGTQQI